MLRLQSVATVTFGDFEWDADKAKANLAKHGVPFEEAVTVFLDLDYLLTRDADRARTIRGYGDVRTGPGLVRRALRTGREASHDQCAARDTSGARDL